jgi:hypothetical protein
VNSAVTYLGLVHVGLLIAFVISLFGVGWFWLFAFAASMSDSQQNDTPWMDWLIITHVVPVALLVAWWLT